MEISWNFVSPKKWEPWSVSSNVNEPLHATFFSPCPLFTPLLLPSTTMFLHLSVILSTGRGVSASVHARIHPPPKSTPPEAHTPPLLKHTPWKHTLPEAHPQVHTHPRKHTPPEAHPPTEAPPFPRSTPPSRWSPQRTVSILRECFLV